MIQKLVPSPFLRCHSLAIFPCKKCQRAEIKKEMTQKVSKRFVFVQQAFPCKDKGLIAWQLGQIFTQNNPFLAPTLNEWVGAVARLSVGKCNCAHSSILLSFHNVTAAIIPPLLSFCWNNLECHKLHVSCRHFTFSHQLGLQSQIPFVFYNHNIMRKM